MKLKKISSPEKDLENGNTLKGRHHLSSFQAELAAIISDAAIRNFKDLKEMDAFQAMQFGRIIRNYSSNLTFAMDKLALDARLS